MKLFSLATLSLYTAATVAIPVRRAPEPDVLTFSSEASILSTCKTATFTWTLPSANPNVDIANIFVQSLSSNLTRSIGGQPGRVTSIDWTVDVPAGQYVVSANLAQKDDAVTVVESDSFIVAQGVDTSCVQSDETDSIPTSPASATSPTAAIPVAENVEEAPSSSAPVASSVPQSTSKGPSPGAIAGLVVGVLLLLVVGGALVWHRITGARERANEQYPLPPTVHRSKTSDERRDSESTVVDIEVVARAPTPLGMASMTKLGRTQSKPLVAELDTEQTQKMLRQLK